ncbi:MAG TPA: hypothetical protein VF002_04495 [Gaiellaceae bacterium]
MIVRIMGEGQYRVADEEGRRLNELDRQAEQALERGDEEGLQKLLRQLAETVRSAGERLDDADLSPSDGLVPPDDLSLEEAREFFEGEGLIPDLPGRT